MMMSLKYIAGHIMATHMFNLCFHDFKLLIVNKRM